MDSQLFEEIYSKIVKTVQILSELGYNPEPCVPEEFYDYMTGEIFSEDKTTLRDVLDSQSLMLHELVEISELKKTGASIHKRVIVDSPKEVVYSAHLYAMEFELYFLLLSEDYHMLAKRLHSHYIVLRTDPHMPDSMKPRAQEIYDRFKAKRGEIQSTRSPERVPDSS